MNNSSSSKALEAIHTCTHKHMAKNAVKLTFMFKCVSTLPASSAMLSCVGLTGSQQPDVQGAFGRLPDTVARFTLAMSLC